MQRVQSKRVLWLADMAFMAHSVLTALGIIWAAWIAAPGLAAVFGLLWLANLVLWSEWKHG